MKWFFLKKNNLVKKTHDVIQKQFQKQYDDYLNASGGNHQKVIIEFKKFAETFKKEHHIENTNAIGYKYSQQRSA